MKTFTKVALITAGIALSAGISLTVVGFIVNRGKPVKVYWDDGVHVTREPHVLQMQKTEMDDFKDINIDVSSADVKFIESEDDKYAVEYKIEGEDVICDVVNGKLSVVEKTRKWCFNFGGWEKNDYFVYVYYPKGAEFGNVMLDTSAGDVFIDKQFDCQKISFDLSAGDVDIRNVTGELDVNMSAGDFRATDCKFGKCIFDLSAGDVDLINCTVNGGELDMSAGDFDAKDLVLTASFDVDMSAGDVTIEFVDGQRIGYDLDLSAGSAKINGEKRGDEYTEKEGYDIVLTCDLSAGSVNITNRK